MFYLVLQFLISLLITQKMIKSFENKENLKYAIALALLIIATKSMGAIGANFIILIFNN